MRPSLSEKRPPRQTRQLHLHTRVQVSMPIVSLQSEEEGQPAVTYHFQTPKSDV